MQNTEIADIKIQLPHSKYREAHAYFQPHASFSRLFNFLLCMYMYMYIVCVTKSSNTN